MFKISLIALALVGFAGSALASPITYQFGGIISGTAGSQTFQESPFTVTVSGDTSQVTTLNPGTYAFMAAPGAAQITIQGVGSGVFTDQTMVFDNQTAYGGTVGFTAVDPAGFNDIIQLHDADIASNFFSTYDLKSNTSLMGPGPNPSTSDWYGVHSTLGPLTVSWEAESTFQATPEPISLSVLGLGVFGLIKRRKA